MDVLVTVGRGECNELLRLPWPDRTVLRDEERRLEGVTGLAEGTVRIGLGVVRISGLFGAFRDDTESLESVLMLTDDSDKSDTEGETHSFTVISVISTALLEVFSSDTMSKGENALEVAPRWEEVEEMARQE